MKRLAPDSPRFAATIRLSIVKMRANYADVSTMETRQSGLPPYARFSGAAGEPGLLGRRDYFSVDQGWGSRRGDNRRLGEDWSRHAGIGHLGYLGVCTLLARFPIQAGRQD